MKKQMMMLGLVAGMGIMPVVYGDDQLQEVEATVGFEAEQNPNTVARRNPLQPQEVDEKAPKAVAGRPLSIDYASKLHFDTQKIVLTDQRYQAKQDAINGKTVPNYVQVTDQRGGRDGWQLQIKQTGDFTHESGAKLKQAALTLSKFNAVSVSEESKMTLPANRMTLNKDYQVLATTGKQPGFGTNVVSFGDVELAVPGQVMKLTGQYKTAVSYNLSAVPTGEF